MGLLNLLFQNPIAFALISIPLLYSIILHELAHGWVAYRFGDPTARQMGRLSLNPLRHLDPIGTLLLFIVGFGWARPVPVNFNRLRSRRLGMVCVSAAGVITNILIAFGAVLANRLLSSSSSDLPSLLLYFVAQINIILAAFNLIPLPPLDGSKILLAFAPQGLRNFLFRIEPFGLLILLGLLYFGALNPVIEFFRWMILSVINVIS
jgi:Zn-dependent protease